MLHTRCAKTTASPPFVGGANHKPSACTWLTPWGDMYGYSHIGLLLNEAVWVTDAIRSWQALPGLNVHCDGSGNALCKTRLTEAYVSTDTRFKQIKNFEGDAGAGFPWLYARHLHTGDFARLFSLGF